MTVAEVLSAPGPLVLIHRSYRHSQRLGELVSWLSDEFESRPTSLGVVATLPRYKPEHTEGFFAETEDVDIQVADPMGFAHPDQTGLAVGAANGHTYRKPHYIFDRHSYMQLSTDPPDEWVLETVRAQREVGANVVLTPGTWLVESDPQDSLDQSMQHAAIASRHVDVPVLVNLTMGSGWLTNHELRERLLNELVESTEEHWYLRIAWPVVRERYGQLHDDEILQAYVHLVEVARQENKNLIFPNTGLTGWVLTSLEARGFSTGSSWSEQAFSAQEVIKIPGGRVEPKNRYFERDLLHMVELTTHLALADVDDYIECECPFCEELDAHDPELDPAAWAHDLAALHYLAQTALLADELAHRRPRAVAQRLIRSAQQMFSSGRTSSSVLTTVPEPAHLRVWAALLADS